MKFIYLLLCIIGLIFCFFVAYFATCINKEIKVDYIQGLEYCQTIKNFSAGDTVGFNGGKLFTEDKISNTFYFFNKENQKIYVRDYPHGIHRIKQEFFVVRNYKWKDKKEINKTIALFNNKTIALDSIRKYNAGYSRFFLLEKGNISPNYQYRENGDFVGSVDYSDAVEVVYEWKICIKESGDIFEGKIGDSILVNENLEFCNIHDTLKVNLLLKRK